ncbi:FliH/SctL family protein [Thalassolituus sp. LLYu03]|uniref:FliH/SctL family protein n=1 Tax=Thalassolituus sp. LLYu03 TaxID=3421656 RepID=UPI003D2DB151
MSEIRSPHHFQPIPAEDAENVKPWRLPFWTEPPAWLAEKEEKPADDAAAAEASEELSLPTAEELENIRRDAYNAGLEQGLVEGRQQGRKDGYDEGHSEGYKAAFDQGHKEGRADGFRVGEEEGKRKAQADVNAVVRRLERIMATLQADLCERDRQLPDVLTNLVSLICERVVQAEMADGAKAIHAFVRRALDELPAGEESIRIFVGPDDARHLRNSLEMTGDELHFSVDDSLPAGSCRIESEHSLVEYSAREQLDQLLAHIQPQLLQAAATFPDEREAVEWENTLIPSDNRTEVAAEPATELAEAMPAEPSPDNDALNDATEGLGDGNDNGNDNNERDQPDIGSEADAAMADGTSADSAGSTDTLNVSAAAAEQPTESLTDPLASPAADSAEDDVLKPQAGDAHEPE